MIKIKNIVSYVFLFVTLHTLVSAKQELEHDVNDLTIYQDQMADLDPLEPLNRGIFAVNTLLDGLLVRPMAYAYEDLVPDIAKNRLSSVLSNLGAPIVFINDLLQGEGVQAMTTFMRFCFNTTFGLLGLFDVASEMGLEKKSNTFDKTFRRWGISAGPYIVLPLFGPSSLRNLTGDMVEYFVDPYNWYMRTHHHNKFLGTKAGKQIYARSATRALLKRQNFLHITDALDKTEDPYAQYRILYMQNRKIIDAIEESAVPNDVIGLSETPERAFTPPL